MKCDEGGIAVWLHAFLNLALYG